MKNPECFTPRGLDEAFALSRQYGGKAQWRAGGTEPVHEERSGKARPAAVIDMKRISALDYIERTATGLRIGALFRARDAERADLLRQERFSALSDAAGALGPPLVRNRTTVVGSVYGTSPAADLLTPLIALDASARIVGVGVDRVVRVEEMLPGPGKTVLNPGELVIELLLPYLRRHAACSYYKLGPRRSLELPVVSTAVMIRTDEDLTQCLDARIVLGGDTPTPMRARRAEAILAGSRLGLFVIEQAAHTASQECKAAGGAKKSAWYGEKMVEVAVKRAVGLSLSQIRLDG